MRVHDLLMIMMLIAVFTSGCGDSDDVDARATDSAESDASEMSSMDMVSDAADVVTSRTAANFFIRTFATAEPLEGAQLCVLDAATETCTTTDANGDGSLEVPASSLVTVTLSLPGHVSGVITFQTGVEAYTYPQPISLFPEEAWAMVYDQLGESNDASKGAIGAAVDSDSVTPELIPAPPGELAPIYLVNLGATRSDTGLPSPGVAGFINVEPGEYTFVLSHPTRGCSIAAIDPDATEGVPVRILAGHLTILADAKCD